MKNKPPAFQFYAKEWLSSKAVVAMTPTQRGYYIMLLAHAWDSEKPGHLPNDPNILWKLARAESKRAWEKECSLVLAQFEKDRDGTLMNERLVLERRSQTRRSREFSRIAKSRWDNKKQACAIRDTHTSASALAFASASALAPANQSQIQSQNPREHHARTKRSNSDLQQRQNIEARDWRRSKEEEVRKEVLVGAGPRAFRDVADLDLREQLSLIAKEKLL
jgi:uncharacterized protein YdaU (DUF1376 family)